GSLLFKLLINLEQTAPQPLTERGSSPMGAAAVDWGLDGETKPRPFLHRAPGGEGRGLGDRAGVGHVLGDRQEGGGRERSQENK
ncbi:33 kDa chaperonin, partial [Dissostichus eleginoides]